MADVARGSVLLTPKFDNLEASLSKQLEGAVGKLDSKLGGYGGKAAGSFGTGFAAKLGAVMAVAQRVVGVAMDAIASSMGAAISRVDTLNNFPKVMQNLGYSAEEAQVSIERMSAAIDGMPTSLDSLTSMTQQLAPMCGGLEEATSLSIALNNAFLAGGASTFDQSRAMQQYTQILAKGKPELQDWRTLQEVMPGQLNQIAQALLGTTANSNDLYEALKSGTLTMDDFNQAVMDLNEEGVNGFASFEQQARDATQGIGTAMENVQNRISKAIATIIQAIGAENISGAINAFSSSFAPIAERIAGYIEAAKPHIAELAAFVQENGAKIAAAIGGVVTAAGTLYGAFQLSGVASQAASFAAKFVSAMGSAGGGVSGFVSAATGMSGVPSILSSVGSAVGFLTSPIGIVVAAVAALAAAFVYFYSTSETFRAAVDGIIGQMGEQLAPIIQSISATLQSFAAAVMPMITAAIQAVAPVIQQILLVITQLAAMVIPMIAQIAATVLPFLTQLITMIVQFWTNVVTLVMPVIQQVLALVQMAMPAIQAIIQTVLNVILAYWNAVWPVISTVVQTAFNIISAVVSTVMGVINTVITAVMQVISGDWEGAWNTISSFLSGIWETMKSTVSDAIDGVVQFFSDLPGNILSAIGDLGSLLIDSGKALVQGFIDGIGDMANAAKEAVMGVVDGVRSLLPFSPAKEGPLSGHGYTTYSGRAMIGDWAKAIERTAPAAVSAAYGAVESVRAAFGSSPLAAALPTGDYRVSAYSAAAPAEGLAPRTLTVQNVNILARDLRDVRTVEDFSARVFGLELNML